MWSKLRPQYHISYPTLRHSNRYPFDLWHVPLTVLWISGMPMHFQVERFSYSVPFPFHPCLQKIPSLSGASMSDKALASPHGDHTHNWQKTMARNNQKYLGFNMVSYAKLPTGNFSPQSGGHGVSWGEMDASKTGICVMSEKTLKVNALFFSKLDHNWILHVEFYDYYSTCRVPRLLIHTITVLTC